jgi:lipoprotein-releasing system permease protein
MGYPVDVALRYLGSKKRAFISVGTAFAVLGVTLGVAALATVMSVTGGFQAQFREKVLGVNAHVLVLKYSTDFREYRSIMEQVSKVPGVIGVAPFSINPMMLTHGDATATGVLLKGVDPTASLGVDAPPGTVPVLDLPRHIIEGKLSGLRLPDAKPPERRGQSALLPPPPDFDAADAGAGEPEIDDAGRNVTLLRLLEEDTRRRLEMDAGQQDDTAMEADATPPPERSRAGKGNLNANAGAPHGQIEPDGGYRSVLPSDDDDALPPDVDPDLCADPAKVAKMPGIVIGVTLAKTLNLKIGECVAVTSPTIGYSFSGGSLKPPVAKRFRVVAVFEAGFDQYDSKLVYTDLYEAQTFYDQGDTVTGVEMKVADIDKGSQIAKEINQALSSGIYHTMDWEELNHGLFTALRIQQIGMSAVLFLIIVVAAFTVVATLIMVVLDKRKEIAVLKAMGATDFAILRIFLYQGGIIGVVGTTLGLIIGVLLCKGLLVYGFPLDPKVYFISRLPVLVRPLEFLITGEIAIAICLEATIIPSLYAAGLSPVEGFREQIGSRDGGRHLGDLMTAWLFSIHFIGVFLVLLFVIVIEANSKLLSTSPSVLVALGSGYAVSALALLLWKRWGCYVLCLLWAIQIPLILLVLLNSPSLGLKVALSALSFVLSPVVMYFGLRRKWQYFE